MPFEPRTFTQIVSDSIEFVRTNSKITDYNRGSITRTFLEAAGMEDDEQYYQMVQLLKEFSYRTASSSGLVRRAADFDINPLAAAPGSGNVIFMDNGLERTYISSASLSGGTSLITVEDAGVFSALTPPFTALIAEGQPEEETVTVSAFDAGANTVTLSTPTLNTHTGLGSSTFDEIRDEFFLDAARISYVSGDADRTINAGQIVAAPAVGELSEVRFLTAGIGTISNGDFKSDLVQIRAKRSGLTGNVGPLRVINFPVTRPFADAVVINPLATGGGLPAETVAQFATRISETLASLSSGTVIAIRNGLREVQVPSTGQRVARVSILEEFVRDRTLPGDGLVKAYVDDGSGAFIPGVNVFGQGNLFSDAVSDAPELNVLITEGSFAARGFIIVDPNGTPEILEYSSITPGSPNVFNLVGTTTAEHEANKIVLQIEQVTDDSPANRRIYVVNNIAIIENTFRLFKVETLGSLVITELSQFIPNSSVDITSADYFLNEGKGHVEIFTASVPMQGSSIYVYYNYYEGLIERAQRTLNGDLENEVEFPGVASGGVKALVIPASSISIDIDIELVLLEGFNRNELVERADRVTRNYVNGLEPGADFIRHEMIERVMGIAGMFDLRVNDPATNVVVDPESVAIPGTIRVT